MRLTPAESEGMSSFHRVLCPVDKSSRGIFHMEDIRLLDISDILPFDALQIECLVVAALGAAGGRIPVTKVLVGTVKITGDTALDHHTVPGAIRDIQRTHARYGASATFHRTHDAELRWGIYL